MFKGGLVVQIENITFKVDTLANGGVSKWSMIKFPFYVCVQKSLVEEPM
jgi:hypothetical protein